MPKGKKIIEKYDPEFYFLRDIDPAFEDWRTLAARWLSLQKNSGTKTVALTGFFLRYLRDQKLDLRPMALFQHDAQLPDLWATLGLGAISKTEGKSQHDTIVDYLDWVLRTHLAELDAKGHRVVSNHLHHPFQRLKRKITGKQADISFSHVLALDPEMEHWQKLAAEWMLGQRLGVAARREALDRFLGVYIIGCNLERNPICFLTRTSSKPDFSEVLVTAKTRGEISTITHRDVRINNYVNDFLGWVLSEKLSIEDDEGRCYVPHELHNPVPLLSGSGIPTRSESIRSSLSICHIKELRTMLAEGPNFRDWVWAQQAMEGGHNGGDWFIIDPDLVNRNDPDCVWRDRATSDHEQEKYLLPARVTELWSPVRAVALYLKLELPLRTMQVRMLDSGEADTWLYEHGAEGGRFVRNDSPLATGSESRPFQRGVFHRSRGEVESGLYINTNKTADINKPGNGKGYVIPWAHESVLYWLKKLRNWPENYNPISEPMPWRNLERKHFGSTPHHPEVLEARGTACFLFRDASAMGDDRHKPLPSGAFDRFWYRLLARLQNRCLARGDTLDDSTPIQFVDPDSDTTTYYPPHALRVSLISYLVLDMQLPLPVVSKLIAGHARIIMTLYYTKFGRAYMREILAEAERKELQADQANHARFLMNATLEQVGQRFASLNVDAMRAAISQKSAAAFVFEDKGICPVGGGMCDVGGAPLTDWESKNMYAPVSGYPQERNCVRCRFFLSGPAFLPGLQAHFNALSYEIHERSERHNEFYEEVTLMENRRADCERKSRIFTEARELERLSQRYEAEAEAAGKLINDMQATNYLIGRSLEIANKADKEGVQLVAVGQMSDIETGFIETPSELYQLEVFCENAVIYPEIDARKPTLRRSQLLDLMLEFNKMPPVFFRLDQKQQLAAGNAVMKLIQSRTGSLKGAVEYAEGQRQLQELGIVDETLDAIADAVAGTPAREIIDSVRVRATLLYDKTGENHAS